MRTVQLTSDYKAYVIFERQLDSDEGLTTMFQVIVVEALTARPVVEVVRHYLHDPINAYAYGENGRYTIDLGLLPFDDDGRGVPREREERRDVDPLTVALWALDAMKLPTR